MHPRESEITRRTFVKASAAVAATGLMASPASALRLQDRPSTNRLKVGVIGFGGRGTGAAQNILQASPDTEIVAVGDMFTEHIDSGLAELGKLDPSMAERVKVPAERRYTGFNAYKGVLQENVDIVILATPPHFRAMHFETAINAGKHVFMEKPVAVDPVGVRRVIAAAQVAGDKKLSVVTGTQRRHERCYLQAMERIRDGAIGEIVAARCYWNQEGLWMHPRKPEWTDMEWQLRNWLYFTWLSGDHIVEQHVHNLDAVNWALDALPVKCWAMGGRQTRTSQDYGHIFDHFAVEYEYPRGVIVNSFARQMVGCTSRVEEVFRGTSGVCVTSSGRARIEGQNAWRFEGENPNPYVEEHKALLEAINAGTPINEARRVAESTLTAIMGRMAAYTGKTVNWEQAMNSTLDLSPSKYEMGPLPTGEVAVPGKTPLL